MAETPSLDDRRYQDLVDDARRWYDTRSTHIVLPDGAPAAVIDAAAFVADQLIYRLNQVPKHLHSALLDIVGVRPYAARPARTDLTFWLAAPVGDVERTVPVRTQVSSVRGTDEDVQTFTTTEALHLYDVGQPRCWTQRAGQDPLFTNADLSFSDPPQVGDALLFGFDRPAPRHAVLLDIDCTIEGLGIDPRYPPLCWEAWVGDHWAACEVDRDGTGGLSRPDQLVLHVPAGHAMSAVDDEQAALLRCRIVEAEVGRLMYSVSPTVTSVRASTGGGTAAAIHARIVTEELLGHSTGRPGQTFRLRDRPLVEPDADVVVETLEFDRWLAWRTVPDFAASGASDLHVQIDPGAGEVRFGPLVRHPDGVRAQHGAIPRDGALVRLRNHLVGGGTAGNVPRGRLVVLATTVPYVATVENRAAARGGIDAETEDEAKVRLPLALRTRDRAVTVEDYEHLTRVAAPELARVHCLPGDEPASVRVLVVPAVGADGPVSLADLAPAEETMQRIAEYLDERRVVGTRVLIEPPRYHVLRVAARLSCRRADPSEVLKQATAALYRFYHPFVGGPDSTGWPFGRPVTVWETYAVLQRVPGVDRVDEVQLFAIHHPIPGMSQVQQLDVGPDELVVSHEHQVSEVDR